VLPAGYEGYDKSIRLHPLIRLAPKLWAISRYLSALLWLFKIRRLISKIKPDVLEAHFIGINAYLAVVSGFHPLILRAYASDILIIPKRSPIYRFLTKYALKKADIVTCDSETVRRGLLELGTNPAKIRKVYNGIDTQQFNPRQRDNGVRSELGMLETPIVICIRNLTPVYNVEMLVRTIPLVLSQVPKARFIIGSDGKQREYLQDLASSLGVSDSTKFIGWVSHDELPKYLASSDIYVSTSLSDGSSLSLQEAMACELSPVVTDLPANREWVTDGENGFIVPINDEQMLADRVICLLKNELMRRRFGKTGRKIIMERAEYEKEMGRMERIYQELVGGNKQ